MRVGLVNHVWFLVLTYLITMETAYGFHPLTSPDVDVKAGFLPDTGYLLSGAHRAPDRRPASHQNSIKSGSFNRALGSSSSSQGGALAARLRRLMSRLRMPKPSQTRWSIPRQAATHHARPGFLTMFTGSKDRKL